MLRRTDQNLDDMYNRRQGGAFAIEVEQAVGQMNFLMRDGGIIERRQKRAGAVQPGAFLVIACDDEPQRFIVAAAGEHVLFRRRRLLPPRMRDCRSIGNSFRCLNGSRMRTRKRIFCALSVMENQ